MGRNKLLLTALFISRFFSFLQIAGIVASTAILIHWNLDREFYNEFITTEGFYFSKKIELGPGEIATFGYETSKDHSETDLAGAKINAFSVYFAYTKAVLIMLLFYFILKEFIKIIYSVQQLQTFRTGNIKAFRNIGRYFLFVFVISCFQFLFIDNHVRFDFDFEITPLILMLVAYILAEIFKEGHRLSEEEKLTI